MPFLRARSSRIGRKPRKSPSPCTEGASRTAIARTPCAANPSASPSEGARGEKLGAGMSSSVARRPGARPATPEVMRKGRPLPASAAPMASMAARSISHDLAKFEKSTMEAPWIVPSADPAPRRRLSRSSKVPRCGSAAHAGAAARGSGLSCPRQRHLVYLA